MFYVYLLRCADKRMYLGCSHDLKERIIKHNKGQVKFTKSRLPIKLISYFAFSQQETAFDFETYLKSGSGRAFLKKHFPLE